MNAPFSTRSRRSFITGSVSPVNADSSENRSSAAITHPSAGRASPASSRIRSPTTMSRDGTDVGCPSRITLIATSSRWAFSTSNSLLLRYSLKNAMPVARRMAMMIPIVSRSPLPLTIETTVETATARSRIRMIGSSNFSRYCFQSGSRTGGVMALAPYFLRNSATCPVVKPFVPVMGFSSSSESISGSCDDFYSGSQHIIGFVGIIRCHIGGKAGTRVWFFLLWRKNGWNDFTGRARIRFLGLKSDCD